jgi:RNA polymerase sigma-70 factor (ECF subfamily)
MSSSSVGSDTQLQIFIDRGLKGDSTANDELLAHASERLLRLTRQMFHTQAADLRRWEQTSDICQNVMLRMHRALAVTRVESVRHFFNMAAMQVRRELIDLSRHYKGVEGLASNHHTDHQPADNQGGSIHSAAAEPENLDEWVEFHERVERLPESEQELFNLLFYEGLTQEEAAELLGMGLATVKRRWQSARLKLSEIPKRERER